MVSIVGYEKEKKELKDLKEMLEHFDEYQSKGIRIPRGLLLIGEPGVGKSKLAKSMTGKKISTLSLNVSTVAEDDIAEYIMDSFREAKNHEPAVLVIDELDKISGSSQFFYMESNDRAKKILIQELDALTEKDKILVVATCNDSTCIGPELLRSGRFDRHLIIEKPDNATRKKILKAYLNQIKIEKSIDLEYIAKLTLNMSGADIECIVNEAGILAVKNNRNIISTLDIKEIIDKKKYSTDKKTAIMDPSRKYTVGVHEVGHAISTLMLAPESLDSITIIPRGEADGSVWVVPEREYFASVGEIKDMITIYLSGQVAERIMTGECSISSRDDLREATMLAYDLVMCTSAYGYEGVISGITSNGKSVVSDSMKNDIVRNVNDILIEMEKRAEKIILSNKNKFNNLLDRLIESDTLEREDIISIVMDVEEEAA